MVKLNKNLKFVKDFKMDYAYVSGRTKSNKNLKFVKDRNKSYVYISERSKDIGMLYWHYQKKIWMFELY